MLNNKWQALEQFQPGGEHADLFIDKLQKQNGWEREFCFKAIEEYKRFVYLTTCSDTALSPSAVVDEVWHLHLTFSRCYWERLCQSILKYQLHHEPAMPSKLNTMRDQYLDTLELYREHFHQEPSDDFWPKPANDQISAQQKRVFPKIVITATAFMAAAAAASSNQTSNDLGLLNWFIGLGVAAIVVFLIARAATEKSSGGQGGGATGGYVGCSSDSSGGDSGCSGGCGAGCGG